jgi:endoglucanase
MTKNVFLIILLGLFFIANQAHSKVKFHEIRTASDNIIVAFFTSDTVNIEEVETTDLSLWKINGQPAKSINKYVMQANECNHHIYLETEKLVKGRKYKVETPFGTKEFTFDEREIFCESIKTNQIGYSAFSKVRYANFAIWLGTGGSRKIEGGLPVYEVFEIATGKTVFNGKLKEYGEDTSAGGFVYRIDLSSVPEGGPYKIAVNGFGSSYAFGVGGEFSKMLAHTIFRAQYLQRCGCPINDPDIRKHACHTLIYKVNGPIGEANIDVAGNEPTFTMFGGYHDAGDADRRAYHMANPILNLMIYEAFPAYFTDDQFHIPGDFDEDYNILNYANNIPDIVDEAEWGTLAWEYLQNEDGSIQFGTETHGYPDPFAAPLDLDKKKYGTVKVDDRATCTGAGLFLHLARIIQPYKPEKAAELIKRGENAMKNSSEKMADPEKLYYYIQHYLLTKNEGDHQKIKALYIIADSMKLNLTITPGYSLNDKRFDNPAYILSYVLAKDVPTDPAIVAYFKNAIKNAADANLEELHSHIFPVGNNPEQGGWGHNVRQPQYAAIPLLQWSLSKEQKYFDAASELMDYKLGLNPVGISYVTGLGVHQVHNIHDRESAYTEGLGWGSKPGITAFGPGVVGRRSNAKVIPAIKDLPKERQYVDDRAIINFNEFTIFETMHYDALYTILSGGGKWNGKNPFELNK